MTGLYVVLEQPRCVSSEFGDAEGTRVQIIASEPSDLENLPDGSAVSIEAEEYAAPGTAWHTGDIVAVGVRMVGYELPEN